MPAGARAFIKPFDEKKPSCDIRNPTLRGGVSATGASTRSSSLFSAIQEAYICQPFMV
jgi:hypothetical protein